MRRGGGGSCEAGNVRESDALLVRDGNVHAQGRPAATLLSRCLSQVGGHTYRCGTRAETIAGRAGYVCVYTV